MKNITLLTCLNLEGKFHDDHILIEELKSQGFKVNLKPWETFKDEGEDLILVRTTWNYTNHFDAFINTLRPIKDRLLNSLEVIEWNANKKYLKEFFDQGLKVLPLKIVSTKEDIIQGAKELGSNQFIIKPIYGASAKGLIQFDLSSIPNINEEMIMQRYYPEIMNGEISLIYFNNKYAYAVKKIPRKGDIRVQEEHGGILESYNPSEEELNIADSFLNKIGKNLLYARIDLIPDLGLIEMECIEPGLFFKTNNQSAKLFINAIKSKLNI